MFGKSGELGDQQSRILGLVNASLPYRIWLPSVLVPASTPPQLDIIFLILYNVCLELLATTVIIAHTPHISVWVHSPFGRAKSLKISFCEDLWVV